MAYLSDRMRTFAASGSLQVAVLLEKADDLDEALTKDPSDVTTVLGAWARARALWSEVTGSHSAKAAAIRSLATMAGDSRGGLSGG
jgi:hypothetical protein